MVERIAYLKKPPLEGKCYSSYVLYKISGDTISIIPKALGIQNDSTVASSIQVSNTYFDNGSLACNFPVFDDYSTLENYLKTGDDSACINKSRKNNYIDTDDEYGWASTADISPSDLAAAIQMQRKILLIRMLLLIVL